jgi:hypothetical protein
MFANQPNVPARPGNSRATGRPPPSSRNPTTNQGLTQEQIETIIWVALDWGTYRTLTEHANLTPPNLKPG